MIYAIFCGLWPAEVRPYPRARERAVSALYYSGVSVVAGFLLRSPKPAAISGCGGNFAPLSLVVLTFAVESA